MSNDAVTERLRAMLSQVGATEGSVSVRSTLESLASATGSGPSLDVRRTNPEAMEAEFALESLDVLHRGGALDSDQRFVLEAVVMPYHRPVIDVIDDYLDTEQVTDEWIRLRDPSRRNWTTERLQAVGRIDLPGLQMYAGTGFIVGPGLLMTNRHVAAFFAQGLGRRVDFQTGQKASIDFYHEKGKETTESLNIEKVVMIHPWWDMALLQVSGLSSKRKPLTLSVADPTSLEDRDVVVIGYPGLDPTGNDEFQRIQSRIFRSTYYVKRFQPGKFRVRENARSFDRVIGAVTHDCSTAGGNSGSTVIDLETGHVVGLHFAGSYLVANYAISPYDMAQDPLLSSAGVCFSGRVEPRGDFYGPIQAVWDSTEANPPRVVTPSESPAAQPKTAPMPVQADPVAVSPLVASPNTSTWTIPLQVSITIGTPALAPAVNVVTSPTLPLRATELTRESLFSTSPPAATTAPFYLDSLGKSFFNWKTALSLALASKLAYENPSDVERTAKTVWGFETCKFIDADDTQCFVATTPTVAVVSFRGTESRGDWFRNANVPGRTRSYGIVHRGFLAAFQVVEDQIAAALSSLNGRALILTGHSLGGALATVMAAEWQSKMPAIWIATYGQPAVGTGTFRSFFVMNYAGRFCRFVNDYDIVPRIPPGYEHVGRLLHFDAEGNLQGGSGLPGTPGVTTESAISEAFDQGPRMLTEAEYQQFQAQQPGRIEPAPGLRVESVAMPTPEGVLTSISDHSMDNYIKKIAAKT